jgi:hypothetical protein
MKKKLHHSNANSGLLQVLEYHRDWNVEAAVAVHLLTELVEIDHQSPKLTFFLEVPRSNSLSPG